MKIEYRVCPECTKAFYASSDVESLSCPHCGYLLLDRRSRKRIRRKMGLFFSLKGEKIPATLEDYSEGGVRLVYEGKALEPRALIEIDMDKPTIRRRAVAVWTKRVSDRDRISTGFRFV